MTVRDFYHRALAAPLVVPVLLALLDFGLRYRGPGIQAIRIVEAASLVAAVPYLATCLFVVGFIRTRPEAAIARLSLAAPLVFAPVVLVFTSAIALVRGADAGALARTALVVAVLTLVIGYGYVLATRLALGGLRLAGRIAPAAGPTQPGM